MGRYVVAFGAIILFVYAGCYVALRTSGMVKAWARPGGRAAIDFEYEKDVRYLQPAFVPLTFVEGELRAVSGNLPPRRAGKTKS